jgi:hypothetical protein
MVVIFPVRRLAIFPNDKANRQTVTISYNCILIYKTNFYG